MRKHFHFLNWFKTLGEMCLPSNVYVRLRFIFFFTNEHEMPTHQKNEENNTIFDLFNVSEERTAKEPVWSSSLADIRLQKIKRWNIASFD